MYKLLLCICFLLAGSPFLLHAQELKCRIEVNGDKLSGTNKQLLVSLRDALSEWMNNQRWTNLKFSNKERIEATFVLSLTEMEGEHFKGEMQIQAKRPVFDSNYVTTLINYRDMNIDFLYREFDPLHFNIQAIESNLTATMAFYAYVILGLDLDSFSPLGGTLLYQGAQQIVSAQQSNRQPGWGQSDGKRSRALLVSDLLDENTKEYKGFWYAYHRLALDIMSVDPEKGKLIITKQLPLLKQIRTNRPMTGLISLFGDAKLDELSEVYSQSIDTEKRDIYRLLSELYPTQRNRFESLRAN
ncbi:MAG: DUF4835 family protein [Bacteroidales bacterium]